MEHSVEYAEVQALFDSELSVVCLVGGIRVRVPRVLIQSGSDVRRHGDHGKLVIPKWFAISVGLVRGLAPVGWGSAQRKGGDSHTASRRG